jgi:hypothetical protein
VALLRILRAMLKLFDLEETWQNDKETDKPKYDKKAIQ